MKKALKWTGIILAGLVVVAVVAVVGLSIAGSSRLNRAFDVAAPAVVIPTDEVALARGAHLTNVFCSDCHGPQLTGGPFFDEGPIGTINAANISGLAETRSDEEIVRAIRHGLDRDGRPLMIMPSESFIHLSQEDLGAIVAYLKTVPRAGEDTPEKVFRPVGRVMTGLGAFDSIIPASYIDHSQPFPDMPEVGATAAYGEYVARFCQACHGSDLSGGQPPAPDSPPGPDLTPSGHLGSWTEDDFITALRAGVMPDGRQLNPEYMPWPSMGKLTDEELSGLWLYLESLPASEAGTQ